MEYALGIDLGGSSIKSVTVSASGELLAKDSSPFQVEQQLDFALNLRQLATRLQEARGRPPTWIGLSAPGLAATDRRSIAHMPGRLQGLENLDWTTFLSFARTIPVLNDAQAALLGEAWLGAARDFKNVCMLTLGTGVGGAAIVDGKLLRGHIGRGGHLGHISVDPDGPADTCRCPGSLEMAIGNCTIEARSDGCFRTTHDLVEAHRNGDATATRIWLRSVRDLARGIVSFINILDPAAVLIGGGIARSGAVLFDPLRAFIAEMEWQPGGHAAQIIPAALGEYAGAFGAARTAMAGL